MKLTLIEKLGDGAFADVWKARDQLDRDVAVKIVRPAGAGVADALSHAKALARATHANIVAVLTLETIVDPVSGDDVDCVVMELLDGVTLTALLEGPKISVDALRSIGLGVIDGIAHIHAQGMAHGDLHSDNVMVVNDTAKVIDILYLSTLATLTTEKKDSRVRRDLISLRLLLQQLIVQSEFDAAEATEFNNLLEIDAGTADIRAAFQRVVTPENAVDQARAVEHSFSRLTEAGFVDDEAYANALDEETTDQSVQPLLIRIIDEKVYEPKHRHYVRSIWSRLGKDEKAAVITHLGTTLDADVPKGRWPPNLRLLSSLGGDSWLGLSKLSQLRLEGLISKDTLAGHTDIHSAKALSGGALGTYAMSFWQHFRKPEILADNIVSLLRQNWYTQNYVASYFMHIIPSLAKATGKRAEFIEALKLAVRNDARVVKSKLVELPRDWVDELGN